MIDDYTAVADAMNRSACQVPGSDFAWDWRRRTFADLRRRPRRRSSTRWDERLAEFDQRMTDYPALAAGMTTDEQIACLLDAGLLISTAVIAPALAASCRIWSTR